MNTQTTLSSKDVRHHGAECDNSTDDTAAWQAAMMASVLRGPESPFSRSPDKDDQPRSECI